MTATKTVQEWFETEGSMMDAIVSDLVEYRECLREKGDDKAFDVGYRIRTLERYRRTTGRDTPILSEAQAKKLSKKKVTRRKKG